MLPLLLTLLMPLGGCRMINADRILARDLAAVVPVFAALPPELELSFAPVPGVTRTFHAAELRRLAQTNHLEGPIPGDVCFAWEVAIPDHPAVKAALEKALAGKQAQIELLEQSLIAGPKGEIVFPLSGLSGSSAAPVVWRGYIEYAGGKRFSIWARVRITVKETRLIATETLDTGEPITAQQIRLETYEGPLAREHVLSDPAQAIGKAPRWRIAPGTVLTENQLATPNDVERGQTVSVVVLEGRAQIQTQGVAEASGCIGSIINVRNPHTGRSFKARIEARGSVRVVPGGQFGLVTEETKS